MNRRYLHILIIALLSYCLGFTLLNMICVRPGALGREDSIATRAELRAREFFAEFLWNRIDIYHHMWEFSGKAANSEKSSLFLMKYAVMIDPHFVKAYSMGAFLLYRHWGKKDQGRDFLMEGIRNNPQSWELWKDMTLYTFFILEDPEKTVATGSRAIKYIKPEFLEEPEFITFVRVMASSCLTIEQYKRAYEYYRILAQEKLLNPVDKENIKKIEEVLNAQ
ncbi:hypothetical protein KAI78_00285 [bacterium]|nr:hypothetical protein [bacterium]